MLKLNVDGAFRESGKNGGWGYVIRDESGDAIQSGSGRVPFASNPWHMELIACVEG
jgi:ribonuclease HI